MNESGKEKEDGMGKVIESVEDYLDEIKSLEKSIQEKLHKDNEIATEDQRIIKYFYRGHRDASWQLRPSLFRVICKKYEQFESFKGLDVTFYPEEQFLIQEGERLYPELFRNCRNDLSRMAIAQHHEIPTRLLDVSGSALVALFFAVMSGTVDEDKSKGRVFVFGVNAAAYKCASTGGSVEEVTINGLHTRSPQPLGDGCPLLVFPPFMTARQRAQDGAFYMFQNAGNSCVEFRTGGYAEIDISATAKDQIRRDLEQRCNIHQGTLFPESLCSYKDKLMREARERIVEEKQL